MRKLRMTVDLGMAAFCVLVLVGMSVALAGAAIATAIDDVARSCATHVTR